MLFFRNLIAETRVLSWLGLMAFLSLLTGCDHEIAVEVDAEHKQCSAANSYFATCTGNNVPVLEMDCDEVDAALLMETPCTVLQKAQQLTLEGKADGWGNPNASFACQWLGIGCPKDDACYPTLSAEARHAIIGLSNPNTIVDEYDVRYRIAQIANIFSVERDPIGMFSIVYRHITNNAVYSVEAGYYEHPEWTRDLITAFAYRYLVNLYGHLTGHPVSPQWRKYYKLARDCNVGRGRVLGVAIATHLMVDLTYALNDVESVAKHEEDYMLFGEISLWVFGDLVNDIQAIYNTDVSGLLQGFFFGDWIDAFQGKGMGTEFIYQTVRANAWRNSQNLWAFPHWMVHADVVTGWGMAELGLAALDASGAL